MAAHTLTRERGLDAFEAAAAHLEAFLTANPDYRPVAFIDDTIRGRVSAGFAGDEARTLVVVCFY